MDTKVEFGVLLLYVLLVSLQAEPLLKIHQGFIKGTTLKTRNGRIISAFRGIPYAQPPIGELRFKNPVPAKSWNEVYLADKHGIICPQSREGAFIGVEDCLYVNVYSPVTEFNSSRKNLRSIPLLSVMVWIHGGAFHVGTGDYSVYGPNYLLDKDIILVSINYRLGALGFLSSGDAVAPGNFGLKDQVVALKWVQKNIKFFGGNPNCVTIFGGSAGGSSVNFHALSEASNGLFHQYIFQSGSALNEWAFRNRCQYKPYVDEFAKKIGCSSLNSTLFVDCLRKKDVYKIVNAVHGDSFNYSRNAWTPTDEIETKDAFLTDTPQNLLVQNKLKDYPSMSGNVRDEGLSVTLKFYKKPINYESLRNAVDKYINTTADYYLKPSNVLKFRKTINDYYFDESAITNENQLLKNFTNFVTDCRYVYPQMVVFDKMVQLFKSPLYLFSFGYRANESLVFLEDGLRGNIGVTHAEELLYLFPYLPAEKTKNVDQQVIDLMVDLWTSFAINGKPSSTRLNNSNLWHPFTLNHSFLQIGDHTNNNIPSVTLEQNYFGDRLNLWKKYFPIL